MRSLVRFAIVAVMSLGMLFGATAAASARPVLDEDTIRFGPCPPGTDHRIGPVCYGTGD